MSLCMRRRGSFDLPGEPSPMVQPALVVPVQRVEGVGLWVSRCMRRSGRFDLPDELSPMVQPALVVPVPRDIPTEGGTSRCASHSADGQLISGRYQAPRTCSASCSSRAAAFELRVRAYCHTCSTS